MKQWISIDRNERYHLVIWFILNTKRHEPYNGTCIPPRFNSQLYLLDSLGRSTYTIVTGRNEVVAKVIFLHLFVILFTGGGVCLPQCMLGYQPPPPPEQTHSPRSRYRLGADTPAGADPPQEQTPPQEADSTMRSMSGRYASYWNAFLF